MAPGERSIILNLMRIRTSHEAHQAKWFLFPKNPKVLSTVSWYKLDCLFWASIFPNWNGFRCFFWTKEREHVIDSLLRLPECRRHLTSQSSSERLFEWLPDLRKQHDHLFEGIGSLLLYPPLENTAKILDWLGIRGFGGSNRSCCQDSLRSRVVSFKVWQADPSRTRSRLLSLLQLCQEWFMKAARSISRLQPQVIFLNRMFDVWR
jgi:hypothetical protein